jgi:methionyl-tRNA formyltransferase
MDLSLAYGGIMTVKLHRVEAEDGDAPAGRLLEGFRVGCGGGGVVRILELQPPGGRRITAADFLRGHRVSGVGV